jgi:hypothetical protein
MTTNRRLRLGGLVLLAATTLAGCSGAGASLDPSAPVTPPPDAPVSAPPGGGSVDPGPAQPTFIVPVPGQADVRPVVITTITPAVDGRHASAQVDWTSGIEPCSVLDHVDVQRDGDDFTVALFEGTGDPNAICIEIAVTKSTLVDLGDLEPGTYTIRSADGSAAPASFTVEP